LEKFAAGKIEARGAGSGTFGFLTSSVSRIIREISVRVVFPGSGSLWRSTDSLLCSSTTPGCLPWLSC
jgi:hypothetical protein